MPGTTLPEAAVNEDRMSRAGSVAIAILRRETVDMPPDSPINTSGPIEPVLPTVGARREVRVVGIRVSGRRRRPSGEKAPLQRETGKGGWLWLLAGVIMIGLWISIFASPSVADWLKRQDDSILERFVDVRNDTLTSIADGVAVLGSFWFVRILRIGTLLGLIFVRRWRHFFAVLLAILLVQGPVEILRLVIGRPRPFVPIIGAWEGPSHPSAPVAALVVTLAAMAYFLVPKGQRRNVALGVSAVAVAALILARLYQGVDHPSDALIGAIFALAVAVAFFRWFAPESTFPVTWKRGVTAHLDVTGSRGETIRSAVRAQLGMEVLDIEPFGLEGSGGSTPLRMRVAGDPDQYVFAKLYSQIHLRSDRWYKIGRTILYGSLEDEVRFTSVRHLVEYEDYIQRLMRDVGVPGAEPIGIVEIAPEREYLMVSEFLEGSQELTDAEIDDAVIDDALLVIRRMWDGGVAHRDIKPANVMLNDGQVVLIDVAFGTVRPSPWRQAVDLANMMLILGLRTSAERVYERALLQFAPEDIAEAFAATRSITMPSQSRSSLALIRKEQGIDLVEEFRQLAPPRERISIQRWSPRRLRLAIGAGVVALFLVLLVISEILTGGIFL
jgi:membrane-associated phospholipid phosphatase/tRNA A-37 threonylcarbamoyl transferase component Bud32